jgi:hypothetical protein
MITFNETHKDILDDITREANRPSAKVTLSISIDGGRAGVVKFDARVTPAMMVRVTEFIDELEEDQRQVR